MRTTIFFNRSTVYNLGIFFVLFILVLASSAKAQPELQIANIGDLKLENGETLYNCKVGYRIFGRLNETKSNAILYPTWFGGTSEEIQYSIGKGRFIDSAKYCIIAVDALGNGISSSPSNYEKGKENFPDISIRDMVNSQFKLVTDELGLNNLYALVGGSMGSMQVFEWTIAYPGFVKKAIPYAPAPYCTSYDLLRWNIYLHIIESGRKAEMPDKDIYKTLNMLSYHSATTPEERNARIKREEFDSFFKTFDKEPSNVFTLDDWRCLVKAMIKHDITRLFNGSLEETAKAVKTKFFIIISETDHVLIPTPAIQFAEALNCKLLRLTNNCGHLAPGCDMEKVSQAMSDFLDSE